MFSIEEFGATLSTTGGGCTQPQARGSAGPAATIPLKMYPSLILKSASDSSKVLSLFVLLLAKDFAVFCILLELTGAKFL